MLKLSIIIPVYNVEKYLSKCLDSVIYPDIADYEIIVVNDGSTDSSPEIAENYARRYPQLIKLINKENGGLGSARNAGIAHAQGEFLVFLDSDDYLSPDAVGEMLDQITSGADIYIFDFVSVNETGKLLDYKAGCQKSGEFSFSEYPQLLMEPQNACNKIWRKSLFIDSGIIFPAKLWFEDLATSPRLYLGASKICYINKAWYNYLFRPGSITNNNNISRNLEMLQVCQLIFDYYKDLGLYEDYKSELEYLAVYHELITSTTRVNLRDRKSGIQDKLLEYFLSNFPDYKNNRYIKEMPPKLKLLLNLIIGKHYLSYNLIMRFNAFLKK